MLLCESHDLRYDGVGFDGLLSKKRKKKKKKGLRKKTTRAINLSSIIYEKMLAIGYQCGLYFGQILISILFEGRERPHFGPRTHMS